MGFNWPVSDIRMSHQSQLQRDDSDFSIKLWAQFNSLSTNLKLTIISDEQFQSIMQEVHGICESGYYVRIIQNSLKFDSKRICWKEHFDLYLRINFVKETNFQIAGCLP